MSVEKNRAWKELEDLSFYRITGTEGEKKAAQQLKDFCEKLGVQAEIEPYEIEHVDFQTVSLTVGGKEITAYGGTHTGCTPKEGVTAPLKYIGDGTLDADLLDVSGKIVLISGRANPKLAKKLKEKGALACVTTLGGFYDDEVIAKGPRVTYNTSVQKNKVDFPTVSIHMRDAEELVRNHSGENATLKLEQTASTITAQNVVATIPGTAIPEEEIVFSAHYDTVIYALGSWDNGSGCVVLQEILQHYVENPPVRTVKFLWCGSEEIGLVGSKKFCETHKDEMEKIIYNINIDMVGVTLGKILFVGSTEDCVVHYLDAFSKIKGFPVSAKAGTYSSDSTSFAVAGVPAASFGQESPRGGAEIHNYRDTLERMDPDSLIGAIQFILDYADTIVSARVNPIPRGFSKEVTEKLDNMKKMIAEMEGTDKKDEEKKDEPEKKGAEKK